MNLRQSTYVALAVAALIASPARANAAEQNGYICSVAYVPANSGGLSPKDNKGTIGYVTFDVYSGPHCSGRPVATGYFCSVGATSRDDCHPFREIVTAAALAQKEATLLSQAARGHRVTVYRKDTKGPIIFVRSYGAH